MPVLVLQRVAYEVIFYCSVQLYTNLFLWKNKLALVVSTDIWYITTNKNKVNKWMLKLQD